MKGNYFVFPETPPQRGDLDKVPIPHFWTQVGLDKSH